MDSPTAKASPPERDRPERWRATLVLGAVLLLYAALAARLLGLQALDHEETAAESARRLASRRLEDVPREPIFDRQGRELALSVRSRACALDPERVGEMALTLSALRGALSLDPYEEAAIARRASVPGRRFVWVRRRLDAREERLLASLDLPGVFLLDAWTRRYPQKTAAAHVLGFTDIDGRGLEGVEAVFDACLSTRPGEREVLRDARRRVFKVAEGMTRDPQRGQALRLTLDIYLQHLLEREAERARLQHKARAAAGVLLDPVTGEILALASLPGFDPNAPAEVPVERRLNAAVSVVYEPGSVFKPFVLAAALDRGVVEPETPFACEGGAWDLGYRVLHDTHPYGTLTAAGVVVKSSNIGIAKIARRLGAQTLHRYLADFGFGRETGCALPGEVGGVLRPLSAWNPRFSMTSVPMGQEVSATTLQLASAFASVVNGGLVVRPRILATRETATGERSAEAPEPLRRVIRAETSERMRAILAEVVASGTGRRAKSDLYAIGGKTGTAEVAGPGGYQEGRYVASFCGFAPVEAPRLLAVVSVFDPDPDTGYYGGTVSAPAVRAVLEEALLYLRVPTRDDPRRVAARPEEGGGG